MSSVPISESWVVKHKLGCTSPHSSIDFLLSLSTLLHVCTKVSALTQDFHYNDRLFILKRFGFAGCDTCDSVPEGILTLLQLEELQRLRSYLPPNPHPELQVH